MNVQIHILGYDFKPKIHECVLALQINLKNHT